MIEFAAHIQNTCLMFYTAILFLQAFKGAFDKIVCVFCYVEKMDKWS